MNLLHELEVAAFVLSSVWFQWSIRKTLINIDRSYSIMATSNTTLAQAATDIAASASSLATAIQNQIPILSDESKAIQDIVAALRSSSNLTPQQQAQVNAIEASAQNIKSVAAQIDQATTTMQTSTKAIEEALNPAPPTLVPTQTTLSAPATAVENSALSLTAAVVETGGGRTVPTGDIDFLNGGTSLAKESVDASGTAVLDISAGLPAGTYSLTAAYGGDAANATSTSDAVTLVVTPVSG